MDKNTLLDIKTLSGYVYHNGKYNLQTIDYS